MLFVALLLPIGADLHPCDVRYALLVLVLAKRQTVQVGQPERHVFLCPGLCVVAW